MGRRERWVYRDGKLTGKVTTITSSNGSKEIVRQKAYTNFLGGRNATKITSRTRIG